MIPHQITLAEAIELTTRFRQHPEPYRYLSETFDSASVLRLLNQPGCTSFRIYLGRKADNSIHSILVAADANGQDILPPTLPLPATENEGIVLENAFHCPPACPPPSPLNG